MYTSKSFKNSNGRVVRWLLALQEYSFEVVYQSGKENTVADALSRRDNSDNAQANILQSEIIQFDPSLIQKKFTLNNNLILFVLAFLPTYLKTYFFLTVKMRAKPSLGQGL